MKTILQKSIPNQEATAKFAVDFCQEYLDQKGEENFTVFFEGGLGVGKTVLIREILKYFGVEDEIPSPTYILVNQYQTEQRNFAHFDLYRLKNPAEFFERGLNDIAEDKTICKLLEWPDKIDPQTRNSFSGKHFTIKIDHGVGVSMRKIRLLGSK
jgi:tRNA threonylcarbamoyl adenosine modification protein YjeE